MIKNEEKTEKNESNENFFRLKKLRKKIFEKLTQTSINEKRNKTKWKKFNCQNNNNDSALYNHSDIITSFFRNKKLNSARKKPPNDSVQKAENTTKRTVKASSVVTRLTAATKFVTEKTKRKAQDSKIKSKKRSIKFFNYIKKLRPSHHPPSKTPKNHPRHQPLFHPPPNHYFPKNFISPFRAGRFDSMTTLACYTELLSLQCQWDEVIVVPSALYGRMNINRYGVRVALFDYFFMMIVSIIIFMMIFSMIFYDLFIIIFILLCLFYHYCFQFMRMCFLFHIFFLMNIFNLS